MINTNSLYFSVYLILTIICVTKLDLLSLRIVEKFLFFSDVMKICSILQLVVHIIFPLGGLGTFLSAVCFRVPIVDDIRCALDGNGVWIYYVAGPAISVFLIM